MEGVVQALALRVRMVRMGATEVQGVVMEAAQGAVEGVMETVPMKVVEAAVALRRHYIGRQRDLVIHFRRVIRMHRTQSCCNNALGISNNSAPLQRSR